VQVISSATFLYALHDALIKPLPGQPMAPAVAESWTESPDGRIYDFTLRQGLTFHNGAPVTAENVHFSFWRYKGASAKQLHAKVQAVEIRDPQRVRFVLHTPWPDFLTVYAGLASGAGWIVPKQYLEQVGDDGFKKHPIGLGPYRFVRIEPGVGLVLEAYERYWRKTPAIHRLILKSVPEPTTRLAMLKTGELDLAGLPPDEAAALQEDPKLRLVHAHTGITAWVEFPGQWDPTSPWHDRRVRLAANLAIDKQALSEALGLGLDRPTGSIIPRAFEFALPLEPFPYDPVQAKRLLAEAGYPHGFDAGDLTPVSPDCPRGRSGRQLSGGCWDLHAAASPGARGLHNGLAGEKAHWTHPRRLGHSRQCSQPVRDLCPRDGPLCLWEPSRSRHPVPAPGSGTRPPDTRSPAASPPIPAA
jgi:peptide/nickel transport system substrate-binding protein